MTGCLTSVGVVTVIADNTLVEFLHSLEGMLQLVLERVEKGFGLFCREGTTVHCFQNKILQLFSETLLFELRVIQFLGAIIQTGPLFNLSNRCPVYGKLGLTKTADKLGLLFFIYAATVHEEFLERFLSVGVCTAVATEDRHTPHVLCEIL
mmetsp:Transcript_48724/g.96954  ORF Transcript_48724/g.96954 Transcript_48724/m.96954 type:complete len:151 (-) Transcript_48724:175-627(-)